MFDIQTQEISDYLAEKYGKIAQGLTTIIAKRVITSTQEHLEGFREI